MVSSQVTIAAIVVAHERRALQALRLANELNADFCVDDGSRGDWGNHAHALRCASIWGTSHVLCIEDDAIPVPGMLKSAREAAEVAPGALISLYVGTGRPRQRGVLQAIETADRNGSTWLEADTLLWGVAYLIPTEDIAPLLQWADGRAEPSDQRVGRWYRSQGRMVRYTWPSLVDHADGPSVIPGRPRPERRVAHRVGTVDRYRGEPAIIVRG